MGNVPCNDVRPLRWCARSADPKNERTLECFSSLVPLAYHENNENSGSTVRPEGEWRLIPFAFQGPSMLRVLGGLLMIALAAPALRAEGDPSKASETLKKLQDEYKEAQAAFNKALRAAKTVEERQEIIAKENPTPKFAPRFYEFAEKNSKE